MANNIIEQAENVLAGIKARCYNVNSRNYVSYGAKGVTVCDEWLHSKAFIDWYAENYYEVEGEYTAVDKDLLGGKVYSPTTCVIIPKKINSYPIGINSVSGGDEIIKTGYGFKVYNRIFDSTGKPAYKGCYNNVNIANKVWRLAKTDEIHRIADLYKGRIPESVFKLLKEYTFKS